MLYNVCPTIIWGHRVYDNVTTWQHGSELSSQQYLNIDNGSVTRWHRGQGCTKPQLIEKSIEIIAATVMIGSPEQTWYLHLKLHIIVPLLYGLFTALSLSSELKRVDIYKLRQIERQIKSRGSIKSMLSMRMKAFLWELASHVSHHNIYIRTGRDFHHQFVPHLSAHITVRDTCHVTSQYSHHTWHVPRVRHVTTPEFGAQTNIVTQK